MTLDEIIQSVRELPVHEKLALIEATTHMVREAVVEYNVDQHEQTEQTLDQRIKKLTTESDLKAIVADLLSRPNPPPEKMLRFGMLADQIPDLDLEDFKIAEWHPTDEELEDV